ncbi:MAG: phosphoribosylformylglycinamidine synthase [Victivallaceae bacterium]|nr:phosphoribosylformylglycinamidine synthase [Victivallaceae bacterium]
MILFFQDKVGKVVAVDAVGKPDSGDVEKFSWLFSGAEMLDTESITGSFVGPRKEMITPWSTNAVEIAANMGLSAILRIEEFFPAASMSAEVDPMLQHLYVELDQTIFTIEHAPEAIVDIEDIATYNQQEGLALNDDEIAYLESVAEKMGRPLTDSEVFGFSQVNSEHCRHKIFNGTFIIDGVEQENSLFSMIRETSKQNGDNLISAYKDNVAFIKGPRIEQFAPAVQNRPEYFKVTDIDSIISLKAETHNFPTTVEPFNGAATGSGGEIRDRMAGGKGSLPMAGTAVYMTPYSRLAADRQWEAGTPEREWLYQTPEQILIKASNGASDFGNKFGQPLICGSVLTFEHTENSKKFGFDKVIMLAGGIGTGKAAESHKDLPQVGDKIVLLGGDNYRIGMGGGAVSSVATGEFDNSIELNAVQRANPEMQKRVYNAIRALVEMETSPVVSIHDHGAGGHLNCLSELIEDTGGAITLDALPIGDPTLSAKEIVGNESQERMGLVMKEQDIEFLREIAERERAPMYVVGDITGDMNFSFTAKDGHDPINWKLEYMFGKPPKTILDDSRITEKFSELEYDPAKLNEYLEMVLQLEAVGCKDWLTNKVDRSVTGKVALQQTTGELQLPLNNLGVTALEYSGKSGIATSLGHAPVPGLVNPQTGSRLSVAESLTNLVWAPLTNGLKDVSLSANWMWPAKNPGENARLYDAVKALSDFAIGLGVNVPTGKDSLSMTQKYPNGDVVYSPGTVIVSAVGEVSDINKCVTPVLKKISDSSLLYLNLGNSGFALGGSSFAQVLNRLGQEVPDVADAGYFRKAFNAVQGLIEQELILAGHDISAGGMITALLEMSFSAGGMSANVDLDVLGENDLLKVLFSETPALLLQVADGAAICKILSEQGIDAQIIGDVVKAPQLTITAAGNSYNFDIATLRDSWFKTSYLLDCNQTKPELAKVRFDNYAKQPLQFKFSDDFTGQAAEYGIDIKRRQATGIKAAIIREKGINGDREMAYSLYLAGFDVKDVHMTDLASGRETLEDINMIVFVGGFSNSDVLGSAKGWAGAFLYNERAKTALDKFYAREDTLSLGICNGCQLMVELGLIYPGHDKKPQMLHNDSGKFESSFLTLDIQKNSSVMLNSLAGSRLGIWVAHGEGKFSLPDAETEYMIPAKYNYSEYPGNPNGSDYSAAAICSHNGRHLAMMPHLERAIFPWQWGNYPAERQSDRLTPWIEAFTNAVEWVKNQQK